MRWKNLTQEILSRVAFVAMLCAIVIFTMHIAGCGEEEVENPIGADGAMDTVSTLKVPDTAPGAPSLEIPEGTPTVKSVGFYSDWRLTKPLTGIVPEGKTIFIKVEFSEGMKLVVADDKSARPILYCKVGEEEFIRFKIADFGARDEDFVSGDAKPRDTKASFICKYVVQPEDTGEFVFAIGKWSVDLEGNLLPAFYRHKEELWLGKPPHPTVKSVDYYSDWQLTKPLTDTVTPGTTIYTKVVFSEEMEQVISDGSKARPELYYRIGDRNIRHNLVPHRSTGRNYTSGDTKPIRTQVTFLCKYKVQPSDHGEFTLVVGAESASKEGVKVAGEYAHTAVLRIPEPPPPTVTITGAPTGINNADIVRVRVRGQSITHYKYSVNAGEECGAYGNPVRISSRLTANVSDFPNGMVTLCVLGRNTIGVWQAEPTIIQWTRDVPVAPEFPDPPETTRNDTTDVPTVIDRTPRVEPVTLPGAQDFSGFVYIPKQPMRADDFYRSRVSPVASATVTAMSGSVSGTSVVTDYSGRYTFRNVGGDTLHLRVEKEGFEPKEVLVHRSRPTTLASGVRTNFPGDIQNTPGNILVGHRWPDDARRVLDKVIVVHDLLYVDARGLPNPLGIKKGAYSDGVVWVIRNTNEITFRILLVHEIMHAHQHAMVSVDGSGSLSRWTETAEGRAFIAALNKDRAEIGNHPILDQNPHFMNNPVENSAEFYALYWVSLSHVVSRRQAPNRFQWADTWLPR